MSSRVDPRIPLIYLASIGTLGPQQLFEIDELCKDLGQMTISRSIKEMKPEPPTDLAAQTPAQL